MTRQSLYLNLSALSLAAALALMFWVIAGQSVAPRGQGGAFDFFLWPAVGFAAMAFGLLLVSKRLPNPNQPSQEQSPQ